MGLAALALVGGLLIAVSRVLPEQPAQVSQASATPKPTPKGTPRPEPTLRNRPVRTMQVDTAPVPSASPTGEGIDAWVRMRTDVTVLNSPSTTALPAAGGSLHRGDPAHLYQASVAEGGVEGWLQVDSPISGWLFSDIDNAAMFERFPYHYQSPSSIGRLTGHQFGFTGFGWSAAGSTEVTLASADGLHWQTAAAPGYVWGRSIADGPAGLLMVGSGDFAGNSVSTVWESGDGLSWQRIGVLPQEANGNVSALAGSDAGYVLLTATYGGQSGVWYSADGLLWTERPVSMSGDDSEKRVVATPLGFVVWSTTSQDKAGIAFSADGWTWTEANFPGRDQIIDVVSDGAHVLALGRGVRGAQIWEGTVDEQQQQLSWTTTDASAFIGASVNRMVSDGDHVVLLGWEHETEVPLWWDRGDTWQRHEMPSEFAGLPLEAAGGPQGMVVVDQSDTRGVRNPVIWHLGAGSEWLPEPTPVMPGLPPPSPKLCGSLPEDVLALINFDGTLAADCFGDANITVRGWSALCEGCYERAPGVWKTAWLASPEEDRVIHLSAVESSDWGWVDLILHPSVQRKPKASMWLEVTGHFDDPHAAHCHWAPTVTDETWYTGTADIVAGCRGRFVVTEWHAVKRP